MWELGAKGCIPKTDAWCEHAFTQVMIPCNNTLHPKYTSLNFNHRPKGYISQPLVASFSTAQPPQLNAFLASGHTSQPLVASSSTAPSPQLNAFLASGHTSQPLVASSLTPPPPHCISGIWSHFATASCILRICRALSHRKTSTSRRAHLRDRSHIPTYMHKQLQQHFQSTPTCISSNIYSTAQLIMVSTSTAQLLASQDINRLFRLCVHPGPVSSHISQPLVASFDKTATAPQTEQYWQSCNSWCKIHAKAVTSIPFSKGIRSLWEYSRWRKWQRHFYLAFPTKLSYYFQYIRSYMCNLIMLVYHNLYLILHIFAHIFHHM